MENNRIEMGTHINQIKQNNDINMNNLVKNLENNIDNIEKMRNLETNTSSYKVGGYQLEHQQLINQSMNPIIVEPSANNNIMIKENESNNSVKEKQSSDKNYVKNFNLKDRIFYFLNKEFLIIVLLFSLLSHRKFNTLISKYLPIVADNRFYTIYIIFKGVIFSSILSFFRKS